MTRTTLVSTVVFLSVAAVARPDDKADLAKLDGEWVPDSAVVGGKPFPDEVRKTVKLVLKGDTYTVTVGDRIDRGTVKIDSSKSPKTLDITGTEGPNKGKSIPAIYEVSADTLTVCYNLGGTERPKAFKSTEGTQLFLVTYKRAKK